ILFVVLLAGSGAFAVSFFRPPSSKEQNERMVKRYYNEVWNEGKLNVLDELLAAGYINHTPSTPNPPIGPDGLKPIVAAIRKAFPDLHYEIKDVIVNDSMAVARVIMTGTQTHSLFGLPPSGKKASVNQITIEKIINGKIVEHWRVTDELTMMKQLSFVK
ncbi:MAG: ester cyclase, partial [Chitinophagaceae bacterium]|nr:ester cyclase [Chitinophagaceae bacterium]